jgi:SAM-dependent methyltransferase
VPFVVPPKFLRNAREVIELGPPADVGVALIDYMCRRIGVPSLAGLDVLDFGCGTRFADAIMNRDVPLRSYTGVDVNAPMVRFLMEHATDPRLEFHVLDARNPEYNPDGRPMTADSTLPVGGRTFDVICMFSVITHQLPEDARAIFTVLRRHVRRDGKLFFSAFIDDEMAQDYREGMPEHPTLYSFYSGAHMRRLLAETGWRVESVAGVGPEDLPIVDSFFCVPVD